MWRPKAGRSWSSQFIFLSEVHLLWNSPSYTLPIFLLGCLSCIYLYAELPECRVPHSGSYGARVTWHSQLTISFFPGLMVIFATHEFLFAQIWQSFSLWTLCFSPCLRRSSYSTSKWYKCSRIFPSNINVFCFLHLDLYFTWHLFLHRMLGRDLNFFFW